MIVRVGRKSRVCDGKQERKEEREVGREIGGECKENG